MKTTPSNQQHPCESLLNSGLWQRLSSPVLLCISAVRKRLFFQNALAMSRALHASLVSLVQEVNNNNRLLAALFLMLAVAPLSGCLYLLFNKNTVIDGWYYVNYFNLFVGLRGNLLALFSIAGIWFLFPAQYKASYLLAAPMGFIVADIIKKLLATTNAEYNAITAFPYVILSICLVFGILKSLDYFLYKHHHIKRKYWAHVVGIIRAPGIPAEQKMKMLEGEITHVEKDYYAIY